MAPLPAGRAVAPAGRPGAPRPRGPGRGRGLLRRPGRRAPRAARRGAPSVARPARAGPARPRLPMASEAVRRLRDPSRAGIAIGEAMLDQRALAGIGNVYKSECLWIERVSPFATVADLDDATLGRLVETARRLLVANADRDPWPGTRHDHRRPRRARSALRLRPDRPAVPALPDADRQRDAGDRHPAHDLLVPDLPAGARLIEPSPVSSRPMCEHYIARSTEPFRLDDLWPFTERLERYRDRRLRLGRGLARRRRPARLVPRRPGVPRRSAARDGRGDRNHRCAGPPPPAVAAVDARLRGHPAVRRPGRPLRLQPQRRPARLPAPPRPRIAPRAGSTAGRTARSGERWLEDAWHADEPVGHLLAALHDRFGGQANLAVLAADGTPYHYAGNGENPVFSFRLGSIGVVSTGIYSLDRSLFRFVATGATDRRLVPLHDTVSLGDDGTVTSAA